ncbi:MAG TPA: hypothetical protein VE422_02145 [Terriglobia bacterium]|nr:hypothetical protein [Terriglobia bacterium]
MLNALLTVAVLLALPVVLLLACCRRPDPNHEFMLDLLEENIRENRGDLMHVD